MNSDLISREALKKALNYIYDCAYIESKSKEGIASDIIEEIDNAPTVEQEVYMTAKDYNLFLEGYKQGNKDFARPQGAWISANGTYYCSRCKHYAYERQKFDFCQDCGADMRGSVG